MILSAYNSLGWEGKKLYKKESCDLLSSIKNDINLCLTSLHSLMQL